MPFYADLHIHSKYSRATSGDLDLENLSLWAQRKGIAVVGTGDFTHPAWRAELRERLVPAEPGLFRLKPELERAVAAGVPAACAASVRFLHTVEISTIYKRGDRTRKVHHLVLAPSFEAVDNIVGRLARVGNLASDGRPILGLDSRDLLEIVLESDPGAFLIPAHIWTPWFSALGSKSGFDSIDECYGDLAPHIFAVETGLSSDPAMNWRVSRLDRFSLTSSSDAHSPARLGREASAFDVPLDYFAMRSALETGEGYAGTVEFFPEEGKYHLDGHRACDVRRTPEESRATEGRCPVCGKPLTLGVLHRVDALADRPEGVPPEGAETFHSLIPLPEILGEMAGVGPDSQKVNRLYEGLLTRLGPELHLLVEAPVEDLRRAGSPLLAEGVTRMRAGDVEREAGYDGAYGRIHLFRPGELASGPGARLLFALPAPEPRPEPAPASAPAPARAAPEPPPPPPEPVSALDADQLEAAFAPPGPLVVLAGPGTGKTRTLTARVAWLVESSAARPEQCLVITFTRRAADELRHRLGGLLGEAAAQVTVNTFHGLGLDLLRAWGNGVGLHRDFGVVGEEEGRALLAKALGVSERRAASRLAAISRQKRSGERPEPGTPEAVARAAWDHALESNNLVDMDDLILLSANLLEGDPDLRERVRRRWTHLAIDELQDIDAAQLRLVRNLAPPDGDVLAIGDPDQAIYGFRGADARLFEQFVHDFPGARVLRLRASYRSTPAIVGAAAQVIGRGSDPGTLFAVRPDGPRVQLHVSPDEHAEARFIVESIERLIGGSALLSMDTGRVEGWESPDYGFSDFAVLTRTDAAASPIALALERAGIPYQRRSTSRLLDIPSVAALLDAAETKDLRLDSLRARLEAAAGTDPERRAALDLLLPLLARAGDDQARFQAELTLSNEADVLDPRAARVSLLTLHAAKGLEFRVVFLAGCEDGLIPLRFGAECADIEEERRLFYVGMTRARERLTLTRAERRKERARVIQRPPSPFLEDIAARLLDRDAARARRGPDRQLTLW